MSPGAQADRRALIRLLIKEARSKGIRQCLVGTGRSRQTRHRSR